MTRAHGVWSLHAAVRKGSSHIQVISRDIVGNSFVNGRIIPRPTRRWLWNLMGHSVAPGVTINPDCFLGASRGLTIGSGSFVNYGCFFDLNATTTIGSDCAIGYQVMFVTATHEPGTSGGRAGIATSAPIRVGDGTWIGARTTILAGVTIGRGCVIAAGSVVTGDCDDGYLYAGVPARRKKPISAGVLGRRP